MDRSNNIDNRFHSRLKDHEFSFKPELWEELEGRLDNNNKKRRTLILWISTGIAAIVTAAVMLIAPDTSVPVNNIQTADNVSKTEVPKEKKTEQVQEHKSEPMTTTNDNYTQKKIEQEAIAANINNVKGKAEEEEAPKLAPTKVINSFYTKGNKTVINSYTMPAYILFNNYEPNAKIIKIKKHQNVEEEKYVRKKLPLHAVVGFTQTSALTANKTFTNKYLGLGYHKVWKNKLVANLELKYINRQAAKLSRSTTQVRYFLDKEETKTELATVGLKYIQVPLYIEYPIMEKVNAQAGVYWDVLIGTDSYISKTAKNNTNTHFTNTVFKGMNYNSGGILIGVNYYLTDKLAVEARYNKSISNNVSNEYYQTNKKGLSELQFGVRIDL